MSRILHNTQWESCRSEDRKIYLNLKGKGLKGARIPGGTETKGEFSPSVSLVTIFRYVFKLCSP